MKFNLELPIPCLINQLDCSYSKLKEISRLDFYLLNLFHTTKQGKSKKITKSLTFDFVIKNVFNLEEKFNELIFERIKFLIENQSLILLNNQSIEEWLKNPGSLIGDIKVNEELDKHLLNNRFYSLDKEENNGKIFLVDFSVFETNIPEKCKYWTQKEFTNKNNYFNDLELKKYSISTIIQKQQEEKNNNSNYKLNVINVNDDIYACLNVSSNNVAIKKVECANIEAKFLKSENISFEITTTNNLFIKERNYLALFNYLLKNDEQLVNDLVTNCFKAEIDFGSNVNKNIYKPIYKIDNFNQYNWVQEIKQNNKKLKEFLDGSIDWNNYYSIINNKLVILDTCNAKLNYSSVLNQEIVNQTIILENIVGYRDETNIYEEFRDILTKNVCLINWSKVEKETTFLDQINLKKYFDETLLLVLKDNAWITTFNNWEYFEKIFNKNSDLFANQNYPYKFWVRLLNAKVNSNIIKELIDKNINNFKQYKNQLLSEQFPNNESNYELLFDYLINKKISANQLLFTNWNVNQHLVNTYKEISEAIANKDIDLEQLTVNEGLVKKEIETISKKYKHIFDVTLFNNLIVNISDLKIAKNAILIGKYESFAHEIRKVEEDGLFIDKKDRWNLWNKIFEINEKTNIRNKNKDNAQYSEIKKISALFNHSGEDRKKYEKEIQNSKNPEDRFNNIWNYWTNTLRPEMVKLKQKYKDNPDLLKEIRAQINKEEKK